MWSGLYWPSHDITPHRPLYPIHPIHPIHPLQATGETATAMGTLKATFDAATSALTLAMDTKNVASSGKTAEVKEGTLVVAGVLASPARFIKVTVAVDVAKAKPLLGGWCWVIDSWCGVVRWGGVGCKSGVQCVTTLFGRSAL